MRRTSAPRSASTMQPSGAGPMPATSMTRIPCRGPDAMPVILSGRGNVPQPEGPRRRRQLGPRARREGQVGEAQRVVAQPVDGPVVGDAFGGDRRPEDGDRVALRAVVDAADRAQVYGVAGLVGALGPRPVVAAPDPGRRPP